MTNLTLAQRTARLNAADAIGMLEAFRNPEDGDIEPLAKMAVAVTSIEAAIRQTVPVGEAGAYQSPEWTALRLLAEAARILELVADRDDQYSVDRANAAARAWAARGL